MNSLRKILGVLMAAVMLVGFASPTLAQTQKIFSLKMSTTATPGVYQALYTNDSPGNSVINSLKLYAPAGAKFTGFSDPSSTTINQSIGGVGTNVLAVQYMSGIKAQGGTWSINVTIDIAPTLCRPWNAQAYAGNSLGQTQFTLEPSPPSILTIGAACSMSIAPNPPANIAAGITLPQVTVTLNGGTDATVVMTSNCGFSATSTTSVSTTSGSAAFSNLAIANPGSCSLTATAQGYGSVSTSSFTVYEGNVLCGDSLDTHNPAGASAGDNGVTPAIPPSVGYAEAIRGPNKNLASNVCPSNAIGATATNDILGSNTFTVDWDPVNGAMATFVYTMTFQDEPDVLGLPSKKTKLRFMDGPPDYALALRDHLGVRCLYGGFPTILGTLDTGIVASTTSITIHGIQAVPPTSPIAVWIGQGTPAAERIVLTLTSVPSGSAPYTLTFHVDTRGDGKTTPVDHAAGVEVRITSLPVDPNPKLADGSTTNPSYLRQVPSCLLSETWQAVGGGQLRVTVQVLDSIDLTIWR